ncbi:MAG TPA: ATP:cob(I)alamin adenosyltransferase, partial [Dehalococcoidia bacterium]|nr:ATP:cob(I)alamin adenosyltransferase [Dehalococcoidia bacterium]
REEPVNPAVLTYLNRLSDLLFVMARYANKAEGREETTWQKG